MSTIEQIAIKQVGVRPAIAARKHSVLLEKYFYFFMSLLIAGVVVFGFSQTVEQRLIHPTPPRPLILYIHAAVFSLWPLFLIFQSALVRTHNVRLHRLTGWFGAALGAAIPIVGLLTAIAMTRFRNVHALSQGNEAFLIVPLSDLVAFSIPFALAIYWRKKPEYHRRLVLVASCALTSAAFGRFVHPFILFYAGVDLLILIGVARDLMIMKRIHPVYLYSLPCLVVLQIAAVYTFTHNLPVWLRVAHALVG
jgi:hypothetical protein